MDPRFKGRKKITIDVGVFVYGAIFIVLGSLVFFELSSPGAQVKVLRNATKTPLIEPGAEIMPGASPTDRNITLSDWWNLSLETPCTGVERFFTFRGFMKDWEEMIRRYNDVYGYAGAEPANMQPPENMLGNATNYDCEDIAHATRCLAEAYGINCSFWIDEKTGPVVPKNGRHLGVCCDVGGEWKCI